MNCIALSWCLTLICMVAIKETKADKVSAYYLPYSNNAPPVKYLIKKSEIQDFILGSITSKEGQCSPAWDGSVSSANVNQNDVVPSIVNILDQFGEVGVSFGVAGISNAGGGHKDLLEVCTSDTNSTMNELAKTYTDIIDKYQVSRIDFYLDESVITDVNMRKLANALAVLKERKTGNGLTVSFVLPLKIGEGINGDVLSKMDIFKNNSDLIDIFLLKLYGFGNASFDSIISTIQQVPKQLKSFTLDSFSNNDNEVYMSIGLVLQHGQTEDGAFFKKDFFNRILAFAKTKEIDHIVLNSINRDRRCVMGANPNDYNCTTGVKQEDFEYSDIVAGYEEEDEEDDESLGDEEDDDSDEDDDLSDDEDYDEDEEKDGKVANSAPTTPEDYMIITVGLVFLAYNIFMF